MLNSNKMYALHPNMQLHKKNVCVTPKYATAHGPSGFGADYRILAWPLDFKVLANAHWSPTHVPVECIIYHLKLIKLSIIEPI